MTRPADPSVQSLRRVPRFALALALFAMIWGARLVVIDQFGSDLPFWDQWDKEGKHVYPAWFERQELWRPLIAPHNEHRIAPTLALNLALVAIGGQWDARVQCIVSAALHAAVFAGLFWWALKRIAIPWSLAAGVMFALLGIVPIVWENILSGFQSQFYFLAGFSLLAIGGILSYPAFSLRWWAGLVAGALALVSMGSGFLWTGPVLLFAAVRLRTTGYSRRNAIAALLAAAATFALGWTLHTSFPGHAPLRASDAGMFLGYAARCLAWPLFGAPWLGLILWLPWIVLAVVRFKELRRQKNTPAGADDFLLAAGLWVLLQIVAVAYSRGGSGQWPAIRYGDICSLGLVVSILSLARLSSRFAEPLPFAAAWAIVSTICVAVATHDTWAGVLPVKKIDHAAYERNVHQFVLNDDLDALVQQQEFIPFPNARWLADILRRPAIRELLPASVRAPLTIPGLASDATSPAPPLAHRATRTLAAAGEWRSTVLPATKGWWKIETAGHLGAPGTALQLVAADDGSVLETIAPAKPPGGSWRAVYMSAPREPAHFVARTDSPDRWFAFSEPVSMSTLSYRARSLAKHGWLVFTLGALGGLATAAACLLRLRAARVSTLSAAPVTDSSHVEIIPPPPGAIVASPTSRAQQFFSFSTLLVAALISVVVAIPFLPASKSGADLFAIEARVSATAAGAFQIYYDDGSGFRESLSAFAKVTPSGDTTLLQFPLPVGTYRAFRVDPLDRDGTVTLNALRVVSRDGRKTTDLRVGAFEPLQHIASTRVADNGALEIVVAPGSNDPQLMLTLAPHLVVEASWRDYLRGAWRRVLPIFAAFATLLFLVDRAPRTRRAVADRLATLGTRPARAVCLVAAIAVIASAYPIVFLGKSYVSPNVGPILLYQDYPTLPGYRSAETVDAKLSDVGAVMWQHVPFSMMQHRALAQGELPLWNRYNATGVPLLAQGQSMFGDPLHVFVIATNGAAWAWDIKYLIAKWLFAVGLGLIVLALTRPPILRPSLSPSLPLSLSPSLLVAAATPFIGFFLYRLNHPAFFSLCYGPWPLYCLVRISQATTLRAVALGAVGLIVANLALMNSGTVKEAYMLLVSVNFSGACVLLTSPTPWRERLLKLAAVAWAGVLFVLLTAPIWATFLQTLKNAYTGYNAVSAYQIQPTLLLGLFDEIFYRPLLPHDRVFNPSLNFLLLLGCLYFLATLRLHFANRVVIALAASSLLPLALAFGLISPHWIVTVPFLANIAHVDNTFSCVLIVLWSVLAGIGFATAAQRLGTAEGRRDLIIASLLLGALVFGWVAFRQAAHRPIFGPTFTVNLPGQVLTVTGFIWDHLQVLLVAAAVLALLVHRALARRHCPLPHAFLIALCLAALLWRHGLHAPSIGFESFTARPTDRVNFHAKSEAVEFVRAAHAREPGRGFGFQGNFFPGWTGVYELETVHGPDALVNPFVRELVGTSGIERMWDWRLFLEPANIAQARPFLDALNVRFYFDLHIKDPALAEHLRPTKFADLDVYESPTAWPRAFFTPRLEVYDKPAELVAMFNRASGRPFAAAQRPDVAADPRLQTLTTATAEPMTSAATNYRLTENTTAFRVRAGTPGAVVLTEAFWPGDFQAELNGRRTPVVRLNHAFKGVLIDAPGDYEVTVRYWPKHFTRYLILSAIGAALLLASLLLALRPARRRGTADAPVRSNRPLLV